MKYRKFLLSFLTALLLSVSAFGAVLSRPVSACAEDMWSEKYYRAVAVDGSLSGAEQRALNQHCIEFMQSYRADLAMLAMDPSERGITDLSDLARSYYESCGFGYGSGKDGFMMIWDTASDLVLIEAYGAARDMVPQDYLDFVSSSVLQFEDKYGTYGPLYACTRYLSNYMRGDGDNAETAPVPADGSSSEADEAPDSPEAPAGTDAEDAADSPESSAGTDAEAAADSPEGPAGTDAETAAAASAMQEANDSPSSGTGSADADRLLPDGETPDESLRLGPDAELAGKPSWYPRDPLTFPFYHDESAPRVVDTADIFTEEEEARMEARLAELRAQLDKDLVIFTDVSTYGLSHSVYAADFYDFNGYGCGEDREGVCLMVCMDPDDRGWWACCTGPETMGLYTETVANQIDDMLYTYMRRGDYGEGVAGWIENFRRLYETGSPYNEAWALLSEDSFERFHDENAPRVIDDAGLLTEEEIADLTARAAEISEKYDLDVVIHTALNEGILDRDTYGDKFFYFKGYGYGDNYDGIQLTIFKRENYTGGVRVNASGSGLAKLTEVNKKRLESRCEDLVLGREYYKAASQWLGQTDHMLRTSRAPRSSASWNFITALQLLAGAIFGGVSLSRAKRSMATPKMSENADAYLMKDSLHIRKVQDTLVDTTVQRVYSPVKEERSSDDDNSSSGHSSYSSHYSGSSGSSHSGSGRKF